MKTGKRNLWPAALLCALLAMLSACGANTGADSNAAPADGAQDAVSEVPGGDDVKTFKFAFPFPAESLDGRAYNYFAEQVFEESGGSIVVELYPSDSLVAGGEVIEALMSGVVEMSHAAIAAFSPTIKELTPFEVPGGYRSDRYMEITYGTLETVDKIFQKYGLKFIIGAGAGVDMTFCSNSKLIKTPADLAGMNIRASGKWVGEAMKRWGGNPVTIPVSEVTTAFERGTVDAVYGGDGTVLAPFKLYEMGKYVTFTDLQEQYAGIVMNEAAYNSLSPDQQAAIDRAKDKFALYTEEQRQVEIDKLMQALEENGNEVYILSEEESKAFIDISLELMPEAAEIAGPDGEVLVEALAKLREGYSEEYQFGVIPE
ncbi:MAG: TRAP transporter substrate-binding protein [Clostridiales Family XIII bacterium]|nr:TRAP transporter substrate-binding protein [Clostridiales Family XIII bacterium]